MLFANLRWPRIWRRNRPSGLFVSSSLLHDRCCQGWKKTALMRVFFFFFSAHLWGGAIPSSAASAWLLPALGQQRRRAFGPVHSEKLSRRSRRSARAARGGRRLSRGFRSRSAAARAALVLSSSYVRDGRGAWWPICTARIEIASSVLAELLAESTYGRGAKRQRARTDHGSNVVGRSIGMTVGSQWMDFAMPARARGRGKQPRQSRRGFFVG